MKSREVYYRRHREMEFIIRNDINYNVNVLRGNKYFRSRFLYLKKPCKRYRMAVRFLNKYNRNIYYSYEWVKKA